MKVKLRNAIIYKIIFSSVELIGQVASAFRPVAAIAGQAVGVAAKIGETVLLQDQPNTSNLPKSKFEVAKQVLTQIKIIRTQKVSHLKKTLKDLSLAITNDPKNYNDISGKILDIKNRLFRLDVNKFNLNELKALEVELKSALQRKEASSKKIRMNAKRIKRGETNETTSSIFNIKNTKIVLDLTGGLLDIYNVYKNNSKQVNTDKNSNNNHIIKKKFMYVFIFFSGKHSNFIYDLATRVDNDESTHIQAKSALDINGNLTLAQLLIHKIFGDNESLKSMRYLSPEVHKSIDINKLSSEISPLLRSFSSEHNDDWFVDYYNDAPQWYQNLFLEDID